MTMARRTVARGAMARGARIRNACRSPAPLRNATGFTLVEVLIALVLGSILVAGLGGVTSLALTAFETTAEKELLDRDGRFAMEQMVRIVGHSRRILLPFHDKPASNWPENVRDQTEPPSAPIGDSVFASAVLAVTVPEDQDLNGDGVPDADDDGDGRIDEDLYNDAANDAAPGIYGIDDDGDGLFDEDGSWWWDDDETNAIIDEDPLDGIDNDGDLNFDEDPGGDSNADGCSGVCGVDDDGDGQVDETGLDDDDEDGRDNEDGYNPVVFYFYQGSLWQRTPVPWDETGVGGVSGRDFVANVIAENVTRFRVERLPAGYGDPQLVDLTLELTGPETGERVTLQTRVRLGGAL